MSETGSGPFKRIDHRLLMIRSNGKSGKMTEEIEGGGTAYSPEQLNVVSRLDNAFRTIAEAVKDEHSKTYLSDMTLAKIASVSLATLAASDSIGEHLAEVHVEPEVLGQMVMQALPDTDKQMTRGDKKFWIDFAEWLGPDWLESLRRTVAFMQKAGAF